MKEEGTVFEAFMEYGTSDTEDDRRSSVGLAVQAIRSLNEEEESDKIQEVFKLLTSFGDDTEGVAKTLFEQISSIYAECQNSSILYNQLDNHLTPMILQSIESVKFIEGPKLASATLAQLLDQGLLYPVSIETVVLPKLMQIVQCRKHPYGRHVDTDFVLLQQKRIESASLIAKICRQPGLVSKQYLYEDVLSPFSHLLTDPDLQVRKQCFGALGVFAEMFGEFFSERCIVPHLITGLDDREWVIRKLCCEIFVDVARNVSMKIRRAFLAPKFHKLLDDPSAWVSRTASERLGSFIFTFAGGLAGIHSPYSASEDSESIRSAPEQQHSNVKDDRGSCSSGSSCSSSSLCSSEDDDQQRYSNIPEDFHWPSYIEVDKYYREWFGVPVPEGKDDQYSGSDEMDRPIRNENLKVVNSALDLKDIPISTDLSNLQIPVNEAEDDYDFADGDGEGERCESPVMGESANIQPDTVTAKQESMDQEEEEPDNTKEEEINSKYWQPYTFEVTDDDLMSYELNMPVSRNALQAAGDADMALQREIQDEEVFGLEHDGSDDSLPSFNDSDESYEGEEGGCDMNTTFVSFHHDAEYSAHDRTADVFGTLHNHNESYGSLSSASNKELSEDDRKKLLLERIDHFRELLTDEDVDFILNSHQSVIPQQLLDAFLSVHKVGCYSEVYVEGAIHFAQNLPAVAFTLGKENWPLLKGHFLYLCHDSRIEPALASILHELAVILGPEISDSDLVPVFTAMAKSCDEVKSLLVMHLYDFLRHLSAPVRTKILTEINCFLSSQQERNWRFRYEFVAQCAKLCDLFSLDLLNKYLCGIALTLCTDQVASVRDVALDLIIEILTRFVQSEWKTFESSEQREKSQMPLSNVLCEDLLRGFGNSRVWRRRQTFAMCCEKILKTSAMTDEQFAYFFGDVFMQLAVDRVANIRLKFCEALDRGRGTVVEAQENENTWFMDKHRSAEILDCLKNVKESGEASVRIAACRALGINEDDELCFKGPNLREIEMDQFEHLRRSGGNGSVQTSVMFIGSSDGQRS